MIKETFWVIENMDSENFFLMLDFADANPSFAIGVNHCTHYGSKGMADLAIERLKLKGWDFNLKVRELEVTYQIK